MGKPMGVPINIAGQKPRRRMSIGAEIRECLARSPEPMHTAEIADKIGSFPWDVRSSMRYMLKAGTIREARREQLGNVTRVYWEIVPKHEQGLTS